MLFRSLSMSLDDIAEALNNLAVKQEHLILLATHRVDPWSGTMMSAFQDEWYDLIKVIYPDLKHSAMPNVKRIQAEYKQELMPDR